MRNQNSPSLVGVKQAAQVELGLHVRLLHVVEAVVVGLPDVDRSRAGSARRPAGAPGR